MLGILLAALLGASPALADRRGSDHDRARRAVQAGEILLLQALQALLERLHATHPGQALELELERDDERWIYKTRLLQPDGRLVKLVVDARTAQVLSRRVREGRP